MIGEIREIKSGDQDGTGLRGIVMIYISRYKIMSTAAGAVRS